MGRVGKTVTLLVLATVATVAVGYGGLSWRLSQGPISLAFLNERIITSVQAGLPAGLRVRVADTVLELDRSTGGMQLSLVGVAALGADDEPIFDAPRAAVRLSRGALLTGRVVPRSVWLVEPELTLVQTERGLRLYGVEEGIQDVLHGSPAQALGGVLALFANAPSLTAAGIRSGKISVIDVNGDVASLDAVSLSAVRAAEGISLAASVGTGTGKPELSGTLHRDATEDYILHIKARNMAASDLGPLVPAHLHEMVSSAVAADAALRLDRSGELEAISGRILVGAGHIGGGRLGMLVDEADMSFSWSKATGRIILQPSTLLAGYNRITVAGEVLIPQPGEFNYGTVPIRIELSDVSFGDSSGGRGAVYPSITLEAHYIPEQRLIHISRLDVAAAEGAMSFVGIIGGNDGESPGIRLAGTMLPVSSQAMADLWPPFLSFNTRRWILEHLTAGRITDARLTVDIPPGALAAALRGVPIPDSSYLLEFGLEDVDFTYLGDMPPVSGAGGRATLTPRSFNLTMDAGAVVRLRSGEKIEIEGGRFHVPDLRATPEMGLISIDLDGSVPAMLRLFDHAPLQITSRRGLVPANFTGDAKLGIHLRVPLVNAVLLSDVELNVDGRVENFAAQEFQGARTVSDARIDLAVAEGRILISGQGLLDGVPAEIALDEPMDGSGSGGVQSVTMLLDEAARERLGIGLNGFIAGPITATISDVQATATGTVQRVEADLTAPHIQFPHLGIDKPAGAPASATFLLAQDAETVRLTELSLESSALRITGEAVFNKAGELLQLELPIVRTARGTDISVSGRSEGNELVFALRGESVDLRPSLRSMTSLGSSAAGLSPGGGGKRTRIDLEAANVIGLNGQHLSGVKATVVSAGSGLARIDLAGRTSGGLPVTLRYTDDGRGADLTADTLDGGRLLAWTGLYANMRGGRLQLAASRNGADGPMDGRLVINGFAVADDPSLTRLITSGEQETRQQFDRTAAANDRRSVNPSNVGFDTLNMPFRRTASSVRITDGVLRGPAVGATLQGSIDFATSRMALNGTYVPLYEINNLFGRLPLFGPLLGGRRDEGLFGITYSVSGSMDQPVLTVNPLSFVTPGVFRYILGMDNPRALSRPSAAQREPAMR